MRFYLTLELLFLLLGLPLLLYVYTDRAMMLTAMWGGMALCLLVLWRMRVNWRAVWVGEVPAGFLRLMAMRFAALTAATMLATLFIAPERLFAFPMERTRLWLLVMLLYPVLSALPQEIIYRAFFFRRYAALVPSVPVLGALSAIAFGLSHLMMNNWIAPVFCIIGGLIFAHTYTRTQSLKWAAIEHAAYGCMIFTVGFGYFFYIGNWH